MTYPAPLLVEVLRTPQRLVQLSLDQWNLLLRQAASANLQAKLHYVLEARGELAAIPPQACVHLEWARVVAERHRHGVQWEVEELRRALAELGCPVLLLKGAAYTMAGLAPANGRLYSDVDILVDEAQLPHAEAALMLHGWISTHHDAYDQRYYREWMHELPPMQHFKRGGVVDVHHAILPRTAPVHPDPVQLRAAAVAIPGHPGLQTLAPPDMVLHSATHLFFDGELDHGLRDLVDIDALLRQFGAAPGFWLELAARAQTLQLARPLFYAVRYAALLLHTPVPPEARAALDGGRPKPALLALMDALFSRALLPDHSSCDRPGTAMARFLLYVRANWLRMPPLLLVRHLFHKAFLSPRGETPEVQDVARNE